MNTLTDVNLSREPAGAAAETLSLHSELSRRRPKSVSRRAFPEPKQPTVIDSRINSLKVLVLTLLREVESLESQAAKETTTDLNLETEVRRFEAELIRSALLRTGGRQRRAARLLGMKVTTLNTKIRRYGIKIGDAFASNQNGPETQTEAVS